MSDNAVGLLSVLLVVFSMLLGGWGSSAIIAKECVRDRYFTSFGSVYACKKIGEKSELLEEGINNLLKNNED